MLEQIFFTSHAVKPFSEDQLLNLFIKAREYNEKNGIRGVLLYHNGFFAESIEGEKDKVAALFEQIKHDKRHTNVVELARSDIEDYDFQDWYMATASVAKASTLRRLTSTWEDQIEAHYGAGARSPGFVLAEALWVMHKNYAQAGEGRVIAPNSDQPASKA